MVLYCCVVMLFLATAMPFSAVVMPFSATDLVHIVETEKLSRNCWETFEKLLVTLGWN